MKWQEQDFNPDPSGSRVLKDSTDRQKEEDTGRCRWVKSLLMLTELGPSPSGRQSAVADVGASDSEK